MCGGKISEMENAIRMFITQKAQCKDWRGRTEEAQSCLEMRVGQIDDQSAHILTENKNKVCGEVDLAGKRMSWNFLRRGGVSICVWCSHSWQGRVAPGEHLGQSEFNSGIRKLHF